MPLSLPPEANSPPETGRSLAYIKPDERLEMIDMIGELVGVIGEKSYDGRLRLNILHPQRIQVLTPAEVEEVNAEAEGNDEA